MEQKRPTDYQIDILREIVRGSIEAISYYKSNRTISNHKPQKQLGEVVKNHSRNETLDALKS